jgi:hypothetical protein
MRSFSLVLTLCLAAPASAQQVDLELVLLADASGSITDQEIAFQRQGYAMAFQDASVQGAILNGMTGRIAVTYVEWAANQAIVADWTVIDSAAAAERFAEALLGPPRQASGRNAIGAALVEGQRLIEANGIDGLRRVIDFSGDSANNYGAPPVPIARDQVVAAGITINGLPILCKESRSWSGVNLERAFADQIIGGPGAFVVAAEGRESFAAAVRRKLILEIAGLMPGDMPTLAAAE